jgi:ribosomal protein S18 acetylase RimI-like enzyme
MTPTPTIRPATPADVPHVLPFVRAICDLHASQDPERFAVRDDVLERYARWLPERATDPRSVFLVAQRADRSLCGYLVGTVEAEVPIFWIPECGFIHDIWIEPDQRRHHLAQQLTEAACERFKSIGVKQVRLHTAAFNDTARKLFASCGFRACVVEMLRPVT